MKKKGIINPAIMEGLTSLGHSDAVVICDAGYPIPADAKIADISLIKGIPGFFQTLEAVLNEIIVEEYFCFSLMKELNPEGYQRILEMMPKQKGNAVEIPEFNKQAKGAKFFIRTGECAPCCNIMLVSAPGVEAFCKDLDVAF